MRKRRKRSPSCVEPLISMNLSYKGGEEVGCLPFFAGVGGENFFSFLEGEGQGGAIKSCFFPGNKESRIKRCIFCFTMNQQN